MLLLLLLVVLLLLLLLCVLPAGVCFAFSADGTLVMDPDESEEQVRTDGAGLLSEGGWQQGLGVGCILGW